MWRTEFEKFLDQKRTPVFTVISVLLTVIVWVLIVMLVLWRPRDWGGPIQGLATVLVVVVGTLLNGFAGALASSRGEHRGGQIAGGGVVLWFVTLGVMAWLAVPNK